MLKKLTAMLLAFLLVLTSFAAFAEETQSEETEIQEKEESILYVANPTVMRGEFFTEMWGNSTTDIDVRVLIHGLNLVKWENALGMFIPDDVVVKQTLTQNTEDGGRLYTFKLWDDLYWSDGTQITAWDYAFTVLFQIAPEVIPTGGTPVHEDFLVGFEEYYNKEVDYFEGLKVLDDFTLQFHVQKEYVPFFYEYGLFYITPFPIEEIAPGCVVKDDGDGVYIANEDEEIEDPIFTPELIMQTVLDPNTGYAAHPKKVSGPYTIESWDGVTAEFKINPYFKLDPYDHTKPTIDRLVFTLGDNNDMIEKLKNGELNLLNKVTKKETIEAGLELAGYQYEAYPRVGLSYISFFTEKTAVSSKAVRQAIGYCVDRNLLVEGYTGPYGVLMPVWSGLAQWMYRVIMGVFEYPGRVPPSYDVKAVAKYEENKKEWEELNLDTIKRYTLQVDKAIQLLKEDGWTLNREGKEFDPEKDDVRCKMIDGELIALDLVCWYPDGNYMAELFTEHLLPNLEKAGIKLTLKPLPMVDILSTWYDQVNRDGDMVYLATNFDVVFDPVVNFLEDEGGNHTWNYTNFWDEELYNRAVAMRETEPEDQLGYMKKWIKWQEEFMEELPMLPIYSNMYYDFFIPELQNYNVPTYVTWTQAIISATLSGGTEAVEAEEEAEAEAEAE